MPQHLCVPVCCLHVVDPCSPPSCACAPRIINATCCQVVLIHRVTFALHPADDFEMTVVSRSFMLGGLVVTFQLRFFANPDTAWLPAARDVYAALRGGMLPNELFPTLVKSVPVWQITFPYLVFEVRHVFIERLISSRETVQLSCSSFSACCRAGIRPVHSHRCITWSEGIPSALRHTHDA